MKLAPRHDQRRDAGTRAAVEVSIVMPCLNEAETIARCIQKAQRSAEKLGLSAEVIVADNGSSDGSPVIARELGARVVEVARKGYGAALIGGIDAANGEFVVMGDADDSYDFGEIGPFIDRLRAGDDLVVGNRFVGGIEPGAMPWLHRWLGNPVLSRITRTFFHARVGDTHCGLRAFRKEAFERMHLRATGMEFASEMVVKASLKGMRISEVPVVLHPDGRSRRPHLRTWRDGWRHLRFMLLFSPLWLFLVPGSIISTAGLVLATAVAFATVTVFGHQLNTHFALLGSSLAIVGVQLSMLGLFAKAVFVLDGVGKSTGAERLLEGLRLETGILAGASIFLAGLTVDARILAGWLATHGGALDAKATHLAILGGTLCAVGLEIVFSSFFLSILKASRTGR